MNSVYIILLFYVYRICIPNNSYNVMIITTDDFSGQEFQIKKFRIKVIRLISGYLLMTLNLTLYLTLKGIIKVKFIFFRRELPFFVADSERAENLDSKCDSYLTAEI